MFLLLLYHRIIIHFPQKQRYRNRTFKMRMLWPHELAQLSPEKREEYHRLEEEVQRDHELMRYEEACCRIRAARKLHARGNLPSVTAEEPLVLAEARTPGSQAIKFSAQRLTNLVQAAKKILSAANTQQLTRKPPRVNLDALPPEILLNITRHLDPEKNPQYLACLSLTCRSVM